MLVSPRPTPSRQTVEDRSEFLRREAVRYCERQAAAGVGLRDVAATLGVAPWSLHRWRRRHRSGMAAFQRVEVVAPIAESAAPGLVVVVTLNGPRVEGLDVVTAARLLTLLRWWIGRRVTVYAYGVPVNMRKGFDGLSALVTQGLDRDPLSGEVYLFLSRDRVRSKVLHWDGTGLCVYAKRLERGVG